MKISLPPKKKTQRTQKTAEFEQSAILSKKKKKLIVSYEMVWLSWSLSDTNRTSLVVPSAILVCVSIWVE